jgi:hypothetical protein
VHGYNLLLIDLHLVNLWFLLLKLFILLEFSSSLMGGTNEHSRVFKFSPSSSWISAHDSNGTTIGFGSSKIGLSFKLQRESLDSEGVKLFEKKEETIPSPPSTVQRETTIDPIDPVDVPRDIAVGHKRPAWVRRTLQEAEGHANPQGTFRESKKPKRFSSYVSAISHIIDTEPSCHGEATSQQVWQDAMTEEYRSIMKNDVWDIVPRPEGKSVVTSKWIYKIKHAVMEVSRNTKRDL